MIEADGHAVHDFGIVPDNAEALTARYGEALSSCDAVFIRRRVRWRRRPYAGGDAPPVGRTHLLAACHQAWKADGGRLSTAPHRSCVFLAIHRSLCLFRAGRGAGSDTYGRRGPDATCPNTRNCAFEHRKSPGRTEYLRVRLKAGDDGKPEMLLHGRKGGVLSSLTGADGLVEIPVDNDGVAVGDYLSFIAFRETAL